MALVSAGVAAGVLNTVVGLASLAAGLARRGAPAAGPLRVLIALGGLGLAVKLALNAGLP